MKTTDLNRQDGKSIFLKGMLLAISSFLALTVKLGFHECWKDEWQAWLMARDMNWDELLASLFYEGHPALWYSYLKVWTYLAQPTKIPEALLLDIAHWLVATAAWAVFVFRLRVPFWAKVLTLFGYFVFFEYGILNRGYAFVLLFGFLGVATLEKAEEKPWRFGACLLLLCQTEVFGAIMAGCLWFHFLQERLKKGAWQSAIKDDLLRKTLTMLAFGIALFIATVYPRAKQEELGRAYTTQPFSIENFATAFQGDFANTYFVGLIKDTNVFGVSAIGLCLSALVIAALAYFFWPSAKTLRTFFLYAILFFLFGVAIYPGGLRQWGMQYTFFVMALGLFGKEAMPLNWQRKAILSILLGVQLLYNLRALHKEALFPFTNAELAGEFVRKNVPENVPIVAINKFAAAPVSGYAGRPFHELPSGTPFTYFKWLEKVYLPTEEELRLFAKYKGVGGIVILTDKQLSKERFPNAQPWKVFDDYNVKNENYYLYALKQKSP